jgi:hypothetical protein
MRREWREVLASQRAMLARRGEAAGEVSDERLAEVFAAQLEEVVRWAARRPGTRLLEVDYNELVRRPLAVAREAAAFLGGSLDARDMAAAVLPSLWRQRFR